MPGNWAGVIQHRQPVNPLADMVDPGVHPVVANMRLMGQRKASIDLGRIGIDDPVQAVQKLPRNQKVAHLMEKPKGCANKKSAEEAEEKHKKKKRKKSSSSSSSDSSSSSSSSSSKKKKKKDKKKAKKKEKKKHKKDKEKKSKKGKKDKKEEKSKKGRSGLAAPVSIVDDFEEAEAGPEFDGIWVYDEGGTDPDRSGDLAGEIREGRLMNPNETAGESSGSFQPLRATEPGAFEVTLDKVYTASLKGDKLLWSDGDVWRRLADDEGDAAGLGSEDSSDDDAPLRRKS